MRVADALGSSDREVEEQREGLRLAEGDGDEPVLRLIGERKASEGRRQGTPMEPGSGGDGEARPGEEGGAAEKEQAGAAMGQSARNVGSRG